MALRARFCACKYEIGKIYKSFLIKPHFSEVGCLEGGCLFIHMIAMLKTLILSKEKYTLLSMCVF